jgi:restriction system protein
MIDRELILSVLITLLTLSSSGASAQSSLPPCLSEGTWHNCFGERQMPNGATYIGEWKDGKRHGNGLSAWPDGQRFVGIWLADEVTGRGVATWPDGDKYEGEWLNGKFHGLGTYTHSDGRTESGQWRDGKLQGNDVFWIWMGIIFGGLLFIRIAWASAGKLLSARLNATKKAPRLVVSDEWRQAIAQYENLLRTPPAVDRTLKRYSPGFHPYPLVETPYLRSLDTPRSDSSEHALHDGLDKNTISQILHLESRDYIALGQEKPKFPKIQETLNLPEPPRPPSILTLGLTIPDTPLPRIEPSIDQFNGLTRRIVSWQFKGVYHELARFLSTIENLKSDYSDWSKKVAEANQELERRYQLALNSWTESREIYLNGLNEAKTRLKNHALEVKSFLSNLQNQYLSQTEDGVKTYFFWILRRSPVRQILDETEFDNLQYSADSKIIIIELEYPLLSTLKVKVDFRGKPVIDKKAFASTLLSLYPALTLRIAHEVAVHDYGETLDGIAVNAWVNYDDPVTGHSRRAIVASLFTRKTDIASIRLDSIDPIRCFNAFRGRVAAADTFDVRPVEPIIKFDRDDSRFVNAKDILDTLSDGRNLAAMDWQEFEHLVRELFAKIFEKSKAEVKITQASRDKGVDAVVYDTTPITGGKVVIQAKRYVNIVDVSSVRDLYGTILNEGASKGVLVTTSWFGADSYEFAKDKPIELLDGANLLSLLERYGYRMRIDLEEARKINEAISS